MILGIQIYHDYPSFLRFHLRYKVFSISRHYGWCHAWGSCRKMLSSWKLGSVIMWRVEQFENLCRQSQTFRFYRKLLCNVNDRELPNLMDRNWWIWEYNIIAAIHWKWKWSLFHVFRKWPWGTYIFLTTNLLTKITLVGFATSVTYLIVPCCF